MHNHMWPCVLKHQSSTIDYQTSATLKLLNSITCLILFNLFKTWTMINYNLFWHCFSNFAFIVAILIIPSYLQFFTIITFLLHCHRLLFFRFITFHNSTCERLNFTIKSKPCIYLLMIRLNWRQRFKLKRPASVQGSKGCLFLINLNGGCLIVIMNKIKAIRFSV